MQEPNPELEPDVPDWSQEPASDGILAEQLRERGVSMSEVQEPDVSEPEEPSDPTIGPPPEEGESGDEEKNDDDNA